MVGRRCSGTAQGDLARHRDARDRVGVDYSTPSAMLARAAGERPRDVASRVARNSLDRAENATTRRR
jgi:hypothetical protein